MVSAACAGLCPCHASAHLPTGLLGPHVVSLCSLPRRAEYEAVPSGYFCWCGKEEAPPFNPWNAAHRWGAAWGSCCCCWVV